MPDEYGLPTAAEYAAEQERLDREENWARFKEDVSTGAQIGGSFLPGIGHVAGGVAGIAKYGFGNIARAKDEVAESERERRLRALLRRAELGELVDPEEMAAIEQKYMDPYLAKQRDMQQAALNKVAAQDMGAGSFARAQQAQAAAQAEKTLVMANLIENQRREQEEAERKELAALVEGDIERAQKAAERAGKDADKAFSDFLGGIDEKELADTEWSKQLMDRIGAKEGFTPEQIKFANEAVAEWTGGGVDVKQIYQSEWRTPESLDYGDSSKFVESLVGDGS
jgi:hypothetical protein